MINRFHPDTPFTVWQRWKDSQLKPLIQSSHGWNQRNPGLRSSLTMLIVWSATSTVVNNVADSTTQICQMAVQLLIVEDVLLMMNLNVSATIRLLQSNNLPLASVSGQSDTCRPVPVKRKTNIKLTVWTHGIPSFKRTWQKRDLLYAVPVIKWASPSRL